MTLALWSTHWNHEYSHLAIMVLIAVVIAGSIMGVSFLFGPRNPNPQKASPYECGIDDVTPIPERTHVKFLQIAMLFLIFDVEALAFYPLATILKDVATNDFMAGALLLTEVLIFVGVLVVGYIYIWRKGVFKWIA